METTVINATEYRNLPLTLLTESTTNPRKIFERSRLEELASSIRAQGVLSPLLVRPIAGTHGYEIVAGARRYRAAQLAEVETVPVRIVNLTDAEALEAMLIENLQRRDLHPLHEAAGFRALLDLEEPKYSIEQIGAKTAKSPAYVLSRLKLTELAPAVIEAFTKDEIGVGHALLLAKLQPEQQEQALTACWQESYGQGSKPKRILLPVRHLQQWIEHNILLELAAAPFSKEDAQLVPEAGSCVDCPKRTGHNTLLFAEIGANQPDSCSDPKCYAAKVDASVRQAIAAKPKLVQISTAYSQPKEGSVVIPRNKYVEIRQDKPQRKEQRDWPEYKTCKYTAEAIVTEGSEKGEIRKVCANLDCPIHHAKKPKQTQDAQWKAEQQKRQREEAIAQTTGLRVLSAIANAVPVRLMKRDLLFVVERMAAMLDDRRVQLVCRLHGIKNSRDADSFPKLLTEFIRKSDESTLGRLLLELAILQAARSETNAAQVLREAAQHYKVDIEAITMKAKQEFAAKEKARTAKKVEGKPRPKLAKKSSAA